jgi:hypothetical protein
MTSRIIVILLQEGVPLLFSKNNRLKKPFNNDRLYLDDKGEFSLIENASCFIFYLDSVVFAAKSLKVFFVSDTSFKIHCSDLAPSINMSDKY